MADNTTLTPGAGGGDVIATDDIAGVKHQRVKVEFGADGSATDVSTANPLPVTAATLPLPSGAATAANQTTANTSLATLAGAVAGSELQVDVVTLPAGNNNIGDVDVASIAAGTNNIGDVDIASIAAGDNNIGNVDVVTVNGVAPAFGTGARGATVQRVTIASDDVVPVTDNGGSLTVDGTVAISTINSVAPAFGSGARGATVQRVTIATDDSVPVTIAALPASTNTLEVVGDVAHDAAAAGNPVLVAGIAQDMDDTAPPNRVSAEADAVRLAMDRDGGIFVHPHGPQVWSYHVNGSSALTDTSVHAAPGANLSLYVTDVILSLGAATALNVFFEEGSTTVLGPFYLEAINGRSMHLRFATPKKITANTALTVTSSAAVAHSIEVLGFTAQG